MPLTPSFVRAHFSLTAFALVVTLTAAEKPVVPDWAQPGSATHQQVPPPLDFRRPSTTELTPLGIFEGQTDVGTAVVRGASSFDAAKQAYTIHSAGYNIWYHRDEFRFVWKKMSGDVSLAANIDYPNRDGYFDRKAVLVIRQDLDDDSKEIMVALHGAGLIHLALRSEKGGNLSEAVRTAEPSKDTPRPKLAERLGIEKKGNHFMLYVGETAAAMQPVGKGAEIALKEPFYVGIGFCSHLPDTVDTAVLSAVVLENRAGAVK